MKKLVRLFALAALVIMGGHAMAQTHGYMSLGATFPMGNYGNGTAEEWALTNETSTNGGASIGFNAGLKWDFGVGVPGLNVMLSIDGFYNGLNDNLKEYFDKKIVDIKNDPLVKDYSVTRPRYINLPVMAGLNYIIYPTNSFGIFIAGGVGGNCRWITNYEETIKYVGDVVSATTLMKYKTAFSFAYQVGAGFEVAKNFIIGVSYYDLGGSKIIAERTRPVVGNDVYNNVNGVRPRMLLARIGFRF